MTLLLGQYPFTVPLGDSPISFNGLTWRIEFLHTQAGCNNIVARVSPSVPI